MQQTWEASEAFIGVEGKHKKHLMSSSSLHSYDGINTTTSGAHNEVVSPCIVALNIKLDIQRDILEYSLEIKKESIKNMSYETNNQEGYGLLKGVPSGEKIFTISNKLGRLQRP